jgi:hypothetical protein
MTERKLPVQQLVILCTLPTQSRIHQQVANLTASNMSLRRAHSPNVGEPISP